MPNILIVDDDAALRSSIAETLGDLGHVPIMAADGAQALDILRRRVKIMKSSAYRTSRAPSPSIASSN